MVVILMNLLIFFIGFSKSNGISNFLDIRTLGADLLQKQMNGRGNFMNLKADYFSFANALETDVYQFSQVVRYSFSCIVQRPSNFKP